MKFYLFYVYKIRVNRIVKEQLWLNEWIRTIYWVSFFSLRTEIYTVKMIFESLEAICILD